MAKVLDGIKVLDLSWGISGPMTTMLMADHGADVIKIEPPGGDPYRGQLGYKVWQRGKRSAILDLKDVTDKEDFLALVKTADVLVESFTPGVTERLGIDYETCKAINPRLIYCSITGYGRGTPHEKRPAYDALVASRTGLYWEQRGWPQGALNHMAGNPDPFEDFDVPAEWKQGPEREGPLFSASYWPSLGAFYSASVGINAALLARQTTGRGQWVETSLMQGAMQGGGWAWMRGEKVDVPGFDSWILTSKSPKGHYECADGVWIHNWVPNPRFIIQASKDENLNATPDLKAKDDPDRFGTGPEELFVLTEYQPQLMECVKKFPAQDWVDAAERAGMTMQPVRSTEESLVDPLFLKDGCVAEVEDPELGTIRQVGQVYKMSACPSEIGAPPVAPGENTEEVRAEARAAKDAPAPEAGTGQMKKPLEGVKVLDLGMAIAGPFGCQILSDLGAEVIKINGLYDMFWHQVHIAYMSNRGKKSLTLNVKDPRSMKILLDLVKDADVVHHNMRYDAAKRLKIDYESLKAINPTLIYCHTRGFETGERESLPGNDQTGACLTGVQWEDGGMYRGGKPMWALTSMGDTGNGFLSAVAVMQALYHRDKTGEGQFVDTSIVNAGLLNTSYAVARPDGTGFDRPKLDGEQLGFDAGHRLYETADGWICVVCASDDHVRALASTAGVDVDLTDDAALAAALTEAFKAKSAKDWFAALDGAGVPVEMVTDEFCRKMHDDPLFQERGWVVSYDHPHVGKLDQVGMNFDLSETPGAPGERPLIVGEHTKEVLASMGYTEEQMDEMEEQFAIGYPGMPRMPNMPKPE